MGDGWRGAVLPTVVALWIVCAVLVGGWIADHAHNEPATACPHESTRSNFGEASWSWWPLGLSCSFTEDRNGVDEERPVGWGLTVVAAGLLASAPVLLLLVRRTRSAAVRKPHQGGPNSGDETGAAGRLVSPRPREPARR